MREQPPDTDAGARLLQAADAERKRIGRDLHDGPQQRLVSLGHLLAIARKRLGPDADAQALELLDRGAEEARATLDELRELARGLHPAGLAEHGLEPALSALGGRGPLPVRLGGLPDRRLPDPVELTVHYLVSEALTNAARHAQASRLTVDVHDHGSHIEVVVSDDGVGGAEAALAGGTGLQGLRDRLATLGGSLVISSPSGEGTTLTARIPLITWRTAYEPYLEFGHERDGGEGLRSIDLVLSGQRTISLGLSREWDLEGGPPRPGQRLPVRDHTGRTHGVLEVTRSTIVRLGELTPDLLAGARMEEPDFETWIARRRAFYDEIRGGVARVLGDPGWRLTDDEPMVVLRFRPAG